MQYSEQDCVLPAGHAPEALRRLLGERSGLKQFEFRITQKSLDARHKDHIVWRYRCLVWPKGQAGPAEPVLPTPQTGRGRRVAVVGTGPAGSFAALYLALRGFSVQLLERGSRVERRRTEIQRFEAGGPFPACNNYAFGEGGAGTFSDGKLSSRTKGITAEKAFLFSQLIAAGAPEEIAYLAHPHVGSDKLFSITIALRELLAERGVCLHYDTQVDDLLLAGGHVTALRSSKGDVDAEFFLFANGHSAFDTYRMLLRRGVAFRAKNFALGCRAEHPQELINRAQWGRAALPGVKAAEYRLSAEHEGTPVYSFCMCPGGSVVPAGATADVSVVNGKSDYMRDGHWANAAVVAGINLERLFGREVAAAEALDWLEALEQRFKRYSGDFRVPAMTIADFIAGRSGSTLPGSSYPLGLVQADLADLLPEPVAQCLRPGLTSFSRMLKGYEDGLLLGLESKTSASIQALRDPGDLHCSYPNLFLAGEGSGWSGGIVSSAADGLRVAAALARVAG